MPREELKTASDTLRKAAELVDEETQKRLHEQSDQLAKLATRDADPDHGRLDRHMNALYELAGDLDGEAEELVRDARDSVKEYRKTVPGV
jgi:hypothetical protein